MVPGLAPLHVDNRAEAATEWTTASGVEGAHRLQIPVRSNRQKRYWLARYRGQLARGGVDWLQPISVSILEEAGQSALSFAGKQGDTKRESILDLAW